MGCTRIRIRASHPAANGMVERFHRQLKATLRAADDPENWTDHLPLVLLGIRFFLKSDPDCSGVEIVFGATSRLPGQMISPTLTSVWESFLEKHSSTCSHANLRCDRVRRPLEPPYDGPFRVISRGTKYFRIQRGTRKEVVIVGCLKAVVPDTPPDELCGSLHPAPPPDPTSLRHV
ncbi:hypothetical protein SprV_0602113400 [Sparganum proliferum]